MQLLTSKLKAEKTAEKNNEAKKPTNIYKQEQTWWDPEDLLIEYRPNISSKIHPKFDKYKLVPGYFDSLYSADKTETDKFNADLYNKLYKKCPDNSEIFKEQKNFYYEKKRKFDKRLKN